MTFEKLYNEIYAVVSLKYFWHGYRDGFIKSESPDWVNKIMGFGMEVSQALLQYDGEAQKIVDLYLGRKREEIPATAFEKFGDRMYFYNGRFWALSPEEENSSESYIVKAAFRFDKKLEKLCSNYNRYPMNGLYLFLHTGSETAEGIEEIFFLMKKAQENARYAFHLVFLCTDTALYVLDFESVKIETVNIPQTAADYLKAETERLRNSRLWENGTGIFELNRPEP